MLEQYEEAIEQWWFKHYAKKKDTLLHTYLCIDRVSGGTNLHILIREHSLKWLLYRNNPTPFERTVGAQQSRAGLFSYVVVISSKIASVCRAILVRSSLLFCFESISN